MMTLQRILTIVAFVALISVGHAQESDYDVKQNFESACKSIKTELDAAKTTGQLDSLKLVIDSIEARYFPREKFLDKALYPQTFATTMSDLKNLFTLTYERVDLIQNQGVRIEELEGRILLLSSRIDSLSTERNKLFAELQESKTSLSRMREAMRRLTATMQAKDRLIFALIDSIFLPYDKNLNQMNEVQKDVVAAKLLKANVAARLFDIAADNVQFLEITQLQPKDYSNLIEQHEQFTTKWFGLREKVNAVSYSTEVPQLGPGGKITGKKVVRTEPIAQTHVDSVLMNWDTKLASGFWSAVYKEFTSKEIRVLPFTDGRSFANSIRQYVDSCKARGDAADKFVDEVWKARIDKEWREALSRESMLGKMEYASLDKYVSTLADEKLPANIFLYIGIVMVAGAVLWWFLRRKPAQPAEEKAS
jgi:hypothetical protein